MLAEGTNLYYTAERVAAIVSSSNVETSNYIHNTSNELGNTIQTTSNIISERITSLNTVSGEATSNYIRNTSNELGNTILQTSNNISIHMILSDSNMSNYVNNTSNELGNTLLSTSNIISDRITGIDMYTSNYVLSTSNVISTRISLLNTDLVPEGIHNKYIVDNVYDNNMTITGKLTVSMLEVSDLDVVYESNGATTNTDLITYIDNTTSNIIDARLLQLTNTIATLTARIEALENA
jgi:hypothetical protein